MTFDQFTNKLVEISLQAPTEELRDAALEFYMQVVEMTLDASVEDRENFMKLFENNG